MELEDYVKLKLSTEDYAAVKVEVSSGLVFSLSPRTASFFSTDFLDGYIFILHCPACGNSMLRRSRYEHERNFFACTNCAGGYPAASQPLPWWASPTGVEKIAGLVQRQETNAGQWMRATMSAAELVKELEGFDGYEMLESLVAPAYDPLETRLVTVEIGNKLEEVFTAWKKASLKRKPELKQAAFDKFIQELSK